MADEVLTVTPQLLSQLLHNLFLYSHLPLNFIKFGLQLSELWRIYIFMTEIEWRGKGGAEENNTYFCDSNCMSGARQYCTRTSNRSTYPLPRA